MGLNAGRRARAGTLRRPVVELVCAVWGETYIAQFAELGLAALLAPGNLPALAQSCDVGCVFLTSAKDIAGFEALPAMATLKRHARVRFIVIDDLIVKGQYSVTLTLAFFRGVQAFGSDATSIHFLFWNADFVLADGGLRHLAQRIARGERLIMTGTLRALSPIADRKLDAWPADAEGARVFPARDLVRLALDFPQQHHAAKVINQDQAWSKVPSQMFWRLGREAMLGRFYQAFMLCLRPTRVPHGINGPCDYSFMPELCPGEALTMIDDSDEFFALELGPAGQEAEHVVADGGRDEAIRVDSMDEWLTDHHRWTAQTAVLFKAATPEPGRLAEAREGLERYHAGFMAKARGPISHAFNYYWTWGVAAWMQLRASEGHTPAPPPELAWPLPAAALSHPSHDLRHRATRAAASVRAPSTSALNPRTAMHLALLEASRSLQNAAPEGDVLVVAPPGSALDALLPPSTTARPTRFVRCEPFAAAGWTLDAQPVFSALLVLTTIAAQADPIDLLDKLGPSLAPGAPVIFVTVNEDPERYAQWLDERARAALPLAGRLDAMQARRWDLPYQRRINALRAERAVRGWREDPRPWMKAWAGVKLALAGARALLPLPGAPIAMARIEQGRLRGDGG